MPQRSSPSLVRALAGSLALFAFAGSAGAEPRLFESPDAALDGLRTALRSAVESGSPDAFVALVGESFRDQLLGDDPDASADNRASALRNIEAYAALEPDGEERQLLVIGEERWPVPIPIVHGDQGWYWDMAAGIEEIIDRRVGGNELNAIAVLDAYVEAQRQYAALDRDGDEVREYARRVLSSPGTRDGLYWEDVPGEPLSPFGPLVAEARGYQPDRDSGDPYFGYYFRVLTQQGDHPPGGDYDYVINGNMIGGFAMIAFPAEYGTTGIMTFVVNQRGVVQQKDMGEASAVVGEALDTYDPDDTWNTVD